MPKSPIIGKSYEVDDRGVIFEDRVRYGEEEIALLRRKRLDSHSLVIIHEVKRLFGGVAKDGTCA